MQWHQQKDRIKINKIMKQSLGAYLNKISALPKTYGEANGKLENLNFGQ